MSIGQWFKTKMALLAYAMSSAEKDALGMKGDALGGLDSMSQTYNQGMLSDSLLRGEITLPVKELRWRLYKVLNEARGRAATIVGYDDDGLPIVKTYTVEKYKLDKILRDDADPYPVEMVVKNEALTKGTMEAFDKFDSDNINDGIEIERETEMHNLIGSNSVTGETFTHTEMSFDDMMSTFKDAKTIFIKRELRPKFEIENYTKKLLVRKISEEEKLLEFYVSSYPDEFNRKSRLFMTEIKRAIKNPRSSDMLDINNVGFISEKTIGVADGLEFEYEVVKFDKIVEFNGFYVIKFISKVIINGDNIFEKYKLEELEERYKNKEAK